MKGRAAIGLTLLLGGCMSMEGGNQPGQAPGCTGSYGHTMGPPTVPGVQGPWGQKVPMAPPYNTAPPANAQMAKAMMSRSVPLDMVERTNPQLAMAGLPGMPPPPGAMPPAALMPRGGMLTPKGIPFAPGMPGGNPLMQAGGLTPPMDQGHSGLAHAAFSMPGGQQPPMPPVRPANFSMTSGLPPTPGIVTAGLAPGGMPPGGVMQAQFGSTPSAASPASGIRFPAQRTQVRFTRPSGMKISWYSQTPDGKPMYSPTPIWTPGRYNFLQGAVYRLKLSNIEGRPGLEIYPTLEVVPSNPKTETFLAHSAVPIEFTPEDFKQISEGNFVVKVIYLPDPQYQDVAGGNIDEILSTRLEPGADPILEAMRRGSILLVIRMGNVDQEAPNTPALSTPNTNPAPGGPPQLGPNLAPSMGGPQMGLPPNIQVPYGMPNAPFRGPGGPMVPLPGAPGVSANPGMMPNPGMMAQPGMMPNPGMAYPGMVPPPGMMPNPGMMANPNMPPNNYAKPPSPQPAYAGPSGAAPPIMSNPPGMNTVPNFSGPPGATPAMPTSNPNLSPPAAPPNIGLPSAPNPPSTELSSPPSDLTPPPGPGNGVEKPSSVTDGLKFPRPGPMPGASATEPTPGISLPPALTSSPSGSEDNLPLPPTDAAPLSENNVGAPVPNVPGPATKSNVPAPASSVPMTPPGFPTTTNDALPAPALPPTLSTDVPAENTPAAPMAPAPIPNLPLGTTPEGFPAVPEFPAVPGNVQPISGPGNLSGPQTGQSN